MDIRLELLPAFLAPGDDVGDGPEEEYPGTQQLAIARPQRQAGGGGGPPGGPPPAPAAGPPGAPKRPAADPLPARAGPWPCPPPARQAGPLKVGSVGSTTLTSRSQPSFSSRMCWIEIAFAFASKSATGWYSETQHRRIVYVMTS